MNFHQSIGLLLVVTSLLGTVSHAAESDMVGSADYPGMPRVGGTQIIAYGQGEYDAGKFTVGVEDRDPVIVTPEGKRTRIVYAGKESQSSLQMLRNYQKAFNGFGDFQEHYSCSGETCASNMAIRFVWNAENRIPTVKHSVVYMHELSSGYKQPMYLYGTIVKDDIKYHVSVFTVYEVGGRSGIVNAPIVHLEVLEENGFEADLVFIDAEAMTTEIAERGSIALYGIQFDFDSASIQARSSDTISEIAKTLQADDALSVYVVGHSDSEGNFDYNQNLSAERAASVVTTLVNEHGIAADRLSSVGVGQVAPVASNDTEDGRELNRRVVIVKR